MNMGIFEKEIADEKIFEICEKLLSPEEIVKVTRVCERYGEEEEDVREYDAYKIKIPAGERILKKGSEREINNYEKYLKGKSFNVPEYYGKYKEGEDNWILIEGIEGEDLRDMTDELAEAAAESITEIQNYYWGSQDTDRFDVYMERIGRRYNYIKNEPVVGEAYQVFLERQKTCPRTMSNGDFLEFNAINKGGKVHIIDWGFGGVMPYSLDVARFIAHGTEDRATFPFYMTETQKRLFLNRVYELLEEKPDYDRFLYDIKLAVLNEYVEFVEADEDENGWYIDHARSLAKEIMETQGMKK